MKKKLNSYCILLMSICGVLLSFNMTDRISECYNIGKGMYHITDTPVRITQMVIWVIDLNILLAAGILFILVIRNINRGIVFDWSNIRLFRSTGIVLGVHFLLSTAINYINYYLLPPLANNTAGELMPTFYKGYVTDYPALIAMLFILIISEVFAIGLRLQEEQELTI